MSQVPRAIEEAFFARRRSRSVPFVLNDGVDIIGGDHAGRSGSVLSIVSVQPTLVFLVETGDSGEDVVVPVAQLQACPEDRDRSL